VIKPEIADAIAEAMAARSARTKVTADQVVERLSVLAFANIYDFMRVGENGDPYVDMSAMTREQGVALQEFTVDEYKDGRVQSSRSPRSESQDLRPWLAPGCRHPHHP
jgi:phage terminase small subunit